MEELLRIQNDEAQQRMSHIARKQSVTGKNEERVSIYKFPG